jgi:hypothetical protein
LLIQLGNELIHSFEMFVVVVVVVVLRNLHFQLRPLKSVRSTIMHGIVYLRKAVVLWVVRYLR